MNKLPLVFAALAIVALLAPSTAQATGFPGGGSSHLAGADGGMIVKRLAPKPRAEPFVDLPGPLDPEDGPVGAASAFVPARDRGTVRPSGGTLASPKTHADREIRKLIRKLG